MELWQELVGRWMELNPGLTVRGTYSRGGGSMWLETLEGIDVPGARATHGPRSPAQHAALYSGACVAMALGAAFRSWAALP